MGMAPEHVQVLAKALVGVAVLVALSPFATPGFALAVGLVLALTTGNPWPGQARAISKPLLQGSVVFLGFGTNLVAVLGAARQGLAIAAVTIGLTFLLGAALRRLLQVKPMTATLLSAGTAICGGSAIAAVAAATAAAEAEIAVALGTVFMMNAVALFVFPPLGHLLGLTQAQFGTWAGIAIHDVSSVVAAASVYGPEALQTATVVKLSRTLWIIPVALAARYVMLRGTRAGGRRRDEGRRQGDDHRPLVHRPVRGGIAGRDLHPGGARGRAVARAPGQDRDDPDAAAGGAEPLARLAARGGVQAGAPRHRPVGRDQRDGAGGRPPRRDLTYPFFGIGTGPVWSGIFG